jgi:hypothetical protein
MTGTTFAAEAHATTSGTSCLREEAPGAQEAS